MATSMSSSKKKEVTLESAAKTKDSSALRSIPPKRKDQDLKALRSILEQAILDDSTLWWCDRMRAMISLKGKSIIYVYVVAFLVCFFHLLSSLVLLIIKRVGA